MDTLIRHTFTIYLSSSEPVKNFEFTSSSSSNFEVAVTVFAVDYNEAVMQIPECYDDYVIVRVDYPVGYENSIKNMINDEVNGNSLRIVR